MTTTTPAPAPARTRDEALARITAPGQRFELRVEDVRGQQLEVFAHRQRTLGELLRASADHGDRPYLVTEQRRITYREHLEQVAALATALRDEHGVTKGDRVAICAANCPEWVLAFWATTALGAVAVGLNSWWAGPEIAYAVDLAAPKVVFADERRREIAGDLGVPVLSVEHDLPAAVARHLGAPLPAEPADLGEDDPAVVLFTSGTTGRPKGATHSHRNVIGAAWFHLLNDAVAAEMGMPPSPDRRFFAVTPLFHIAGLHNLVVPRLVVGDTAVMHLGRFDIERVLRLIEAERVTSWGMVPTMAAKLVEHAEEHGLDDYDLSSLRMVSVNSAPSSAALKSRLREVLPVAGRALGTTYGLTESSTAATLASAAELAADPETVGRAVPTMQVEIRDEQGERVPDGVEGEVCLRSPLVMIGYWDDPDATAAATTPDGWFRTGDLGVLVDGALRINSRRSDLILRGGENIYPAEVEAALETHPDVRECLVIGVPHPSYGQEVGAVVVLTPEGTASADALQAYVAERIARYKVPSRWRVTTEPLPRNATGKVIRKEVPLP